MLKTAGGTVRRLKKILNGTFQCDYYVISAIIVIVILIFIIIIIIVVVVIIKELCVLSLEIKI